MKLNCLACGLSVILDDAYGDYEGEIKCLCGAILEVKIDSDRVKNVRLSATGWKTAPGRASDAVGKETAARDARR